MRCHIDTTRNLLIVEKEGKETHLLLYSEEAFHILSALWLKVGWNERYHYTFTWMGQPILQLPEDLLRLQEVVVREKPDLIIETGVAFGGSLLFYATLLHTIGKGHVIGIDVDIHLPNRKAIESHPLGPLITLIEGSSLAEETITSVRDYLAQKGKDTKVLVMLDSNHSKAHVMSELEAYHAFVTPDSYLIVSDGFKQELYDVPRGKEKWKWDHPSAAVREFLATHPEFVLESPERRYNRSSIREAMTHFPQGWLRKRTN